MEEVKKEVKKVIFMGTPDFSCPTLEKLFYDENVELLGVVTKEDKPAGRGNEIKESDVKKMAKKICEEKNIEVTENIDCELLKKNIENNDKKFYIWTPKKIKEDKNVIEGLKALDVDFFVVVAYGQILSKEILEIPKFGCINGHASLLPKYRGASPIQASILAGDKKTGTTTMLMSEGMDEGDILLEKEIDIEDVDTGESMFEKLSYLTADAIIETVKNFENIKPKKQNSDEATYVKMIKKEDGLIDLQNENYEEIDRKVRGYYPWPSAYIIENEKRIKIYSVKNIDEYDEIIFKYNESGIKNNEPFSYMNKLIYKIKDGFMEVIELQAEGKKRMSAKDYMNGAKITKLREPLTSLL